MIAKFRLFWDDSRSLKVYLLGTGHDRCQAQVCDQCDSLAGDRRLVAVGHLSHRLNQPHLLSLTASLFPRLFLSPSSCLDRVIAIGAEYEAGKLVFADEGGLGD